MRNTWTYFTISYTEAKEMLSLFEKHSNELPREIEQVIPRLKRFVSEHNEHNK